MTQNAIGLILMRQLASHLATPTFVVDADGSLLFYNESAGKLLGYPYQEAGDLPIQAWSVAFKPMRENGEEVRAEDLPLTIALREGRPAYLAPLYIVGLDDVWRKIAVTAFPLDGQQGRQLGAVALFSEMKD